MDINGVWASVNFPSQITGFCGRVFFMAEDRELGLACVRAWNDWLYEAWYLPHPDRIVPLGITFLSDPELAASEIKRNAERGFTSVTLPERPHEIGLPSLWDRAHWDPIIAAVVETDTVISLHVGSSGLTQAPRGAPALQLGATLFGQLSLTACAEWLWSTYPLKYPDLKIAMSEGGIGWVAMLLDRLDNIVDRSRYGMGWDIRPAEVLKRNFWFCSIDDPSTIDTRYRIGVENIMVEVDYPHGDSTWPDTQAVIEECWGHIPPDELRAMCCENAARLYRHPLPAIVVPERKESRRAREPFELHPDGRQVDPRPLSKRGARGPRTRSLARGLLRPPGGPHHCQSRRRDVAVQPVAAHVGGTEARARDPHRPRRSRGGR